MTTTESTSETTTPQPPRPSRIATDQDALVDWLKVKLPDRVPADCPVLLVSSSLRADLVSELRRRCWTRFGRSEMLESGLAVTLDELRRELLKYDPSDLRSRCARIDAILDDLENPEPPPPLPVQWIEVAADLALTMPTEAAEAERELGRALMRADFGDRRASPPLTRFAELLAREASVSPELQRLRWILIGHGLPGVRTDDACFGAKPAAVPPPAFKRHVWPHNDTPRLWLQWMLGDVGLALPDQPTGSAADAELEQADRALLAKLHRGELKTARGETRTAADEERDQLRARNTAARAAEFRAWSEQVEDRRERLVAAIDRALADEPLSLRGWWLGELRRHVAFDPSDRPLDVTGVDPSNSKLLAWETVRSFGVELRIEECAV